MFSILALSYTIKSFFSNLLCLQVSAVFAADAVARLSGTVGVTAVTAGNWKFSINYVD